MTFLEHYHQKRREAHDTIREIHDADLVIVPSGVGEPPSILTALSEQRRDLRGVRVAQILPTRKYAYFDSETTEHVRHLALFFGIASRPGGQHGWIDFVPASFSELPALIDRGLFPADVVVSMASPMDAHGNFSLSLAPDYTMAAIRKARSLILEVNPNVPFAGGNCHVHISQVSALVESEASSGGGSACHRTCTGGHRKVRCRPCSRRSHPADRLRRNSRCGGHATQPQT